MCAHTNRQQLVNKQLLNERQYTADSLLRGKQTLFQEKQVLQDELRSVRRPPMQVLSIHVIELALVTDVSHVSKIPAL